MPTVLIEALALGTPVVSTDCPSGPAEILENGQWGTLVPVGDVESLAAAILRVLENLDAARARGTVERANQFRLEAIVAEYHRLLLPENG